MTPRRKLKKEISLLKYSIKMLPFYADISDVYGDETFDMKVLPQMKADLEELEKKLNELPPPEMQIMNQLR